MDATNPFLRADFAPTNAGVNPSDQRISGLAVRASSRGIHVPTQALALEH